mmetsp:Transcript_150/g.382  ORF Transcript_150/g.382 Transcript_150/m.382 type:complete len:267 (-) Transcript_150:335-1135(-)|eukprot:CAMPEP_0114517210 /NCGR_PEP_ID=MMETSP0109-20121206/17766_1 /TAXON_ID=29199 /ORGANISM="Chlorarachnion reptans, Strain CCCM449" /LENGTH=266 /DNA_ID=CAMNT_0001697703 /DNA_START=49 /DNA_END=852 /DNA_ORIENTATION=-
MSATGSGYDLSVTTFSPDGRVFQVEYASKAIEKSGTAIGIRCSDGVVLGVEKAIISRMLLTSSNRRIHTVGIYNGIACSGFAADARQIVNRGREEAANYKSYYANVIPGNVLANRLAGFVHLYTLYWYYRPFGCSVLVGSYSPEGTPELHQIDPSGVSHSYYAAVVGKNKEAAKSELEKIDFRTYKCRDAVKEIARIIYKLHDESKDKDFTLEMTWACDETKSKHQLVPQDLLEEAVKNAKDLKAKEEQDSDDDDDDDDDAPPAKK